MTSIARVNLTRNKKLCSSAQTTCTCLQWCYWICMQRGYSSVVEHSAAVQEVLVSNPESPCIIFETREKWHRSREYTLLGPKNIVTVLKQPERVCSDIFESVCSGDIALGRAFGCSPRDPWFEQRVSPCIIFERLEKNDIDRESTLDSEQKTLKNLVTVLKQPARVCSDVIESVCSGDIAQR